MVSLPNNFSFKEFLRKPISPVKAVIIIFGFTLAASALASFVLIRQPQTETPLTQVPSQPLTLALESPADGTVVLGDRITVKGKTSPNATVVFYTDSDQNSVESDVGGQFEGEIALVGGINTLTVTAFAENGDEKTTQLDLVYDNQVKGVKTGASEPPGQAKKEERANVGSVQEVTGNSIVLEEKKGKKKTETVVDENTKIIGQDKKALKLGSLKPKDLAAIIATDSGTAPGQVKKALKIFVRQATSSAQLKQNKRHAVQGVITAINGSTITLAHQIQRERTWEILVNTQTIIKIKGITDGTLADLKIGQRIALVGDLNEEGQLLAKRIHVIPGKATGLFEKNPVATPSGTLTGTPTITPSATPTVTPTIEPTPTPTVVPTITP